MDKTIITSILLIAGVISAVIFFNALYPAVLQSSDAMVGMQRRIDEQMKNQVEIVHAIGELDASGNWVSTYGDGDTSFDVFIWVKNIGSERISAIERCDVFFGPVGGFARVPYQDEVGGSLPSWTANVENGSVWDPTGTLKVSIHFLAKLAQGRYFVKFVIPNGLSDEYYISM